MAGDAAGGPSQAGGARPARVRRLLGVLAVFAVAAVVAAVTTATLEREDARAFFLRSALVWSLVGLVGFELWLRGVVPRFFREPDSPFNLAIARFVVFGTIFVLLDLDRIAWLSALPDALTWELGGLGRFVSASPRPESLVRIASVALACTSLSAALGLFSRTSAALTTLLGVFVFAELEIHGKIRWFHHLMWIAPVFATVRCGEVLSLDAVLFGARRDGDAEGVALEPSRHYAVALRWAWVVLAIVYFFPGLWKFATGGFEWLTPDNLIHRTLTRWEHKEFISFIRIDQMPWLAGLGGAFTLIFEIGFPLMIFTRWSRTLVGVGGIGFQTGTRLLFQIDFSQVLFVYPILFDWRFVLTWLRTRLRGAPRRIEFDPARPAAVRAVSLLRRFDVAGAFVFNPVPGAALRDPETGEAGSDLAGRLVRRLPALWPAWPLAWPLLRDVDREVAAPPAHAAPSSSTRAAHAVAAPIVALAVVHGVAGYVSWPFTVFPTFPGIASDVVSRYEVYADLGDGELEKVPHKQILARQLRLSQVRWLVRGTFRKGGPAQRERQARALWAVLVAEEPELGRARRVVMTHAQVRLIAPDFPVVPGSKRKIHDWSIEPGAVAP